MAIPTLKMRNRQKPSYLTVIYPVKMEYGWNSTIFGLHAHYEISYALSFYKSQNVSCRSKYFVYFSSAFLGPKL